VLLNSVTTMPPEFEVASRAAGLPSMKLQVPAIQKRLATQA
jgi:hypothetical protein